MKYTQIDSKYLGILCRVYRLDEDVQVQTRIHGMNMHSSSPSLSRGGLMKIQKGFVWDGPSGPTYDSPDSMRGALVHDVLYSMIRSGLNIGVFTRKDADKELHRLLVEDGMWRWRAWFWYISLRAFGWYAAR